MYLQEKVVATINNIFISIFLSYFLTFLPEEVVLRSWNIAYGPTAHKKIRFMAKNEI